MATAKGRGKRKAETVTATTAQRQFSELMARARLNGERFLVTDHKKPAGAIVSADDLARLETAAVCP